MDARPLVEDVAMVTLDAGRLAMEAGASGRSVAELVERTAQGLGAERVDLRIGYASLGVTIRIGKERLTRSRRVGPHGVNQRLDAALRDLARRVSRGELDPAATRVALDRLSRETPRHPAWFVAVAVGVACAAFGRLLGVDWHGTVPVLLASTLGQALRAYLLARRANVFLAVNVAALGSSVLAGLGARWAGSETMDGAMVAAVLLLVPGVPALNALNDILEGRPTLGSARAVFVAVVLVFMTVGIWLGKALLGEAG
jgi:uncharacterized membrane protein YjjP (DUF1212 family)